MHRVLWAAHNDHVQPRSCDAEGKMARRSARQKTTRTGEARVAGENLTEVEVWGDKDMGDIRAGCT